MEKLTGFFEARLEADGLAFVVTVDIEPPGMPEAEAKEQITREWIIHFAISSPVRQDVLECVSLRRIPSKPTDALPVPRGTEPILIWKSVEE
jgi:hypothetical protein